MIRMTADTRNGQPAAAAGPAALFFLLPLAVFYYAFLLTAAGSIALFAPLPHGLTFNSMLLHLLEGRFDVDPTVIGHEGYLRDGRVYAYFGILPALLRAPLLVLPDFATTELTRVSCLAAVSLMALFKVLSARLVWRHTAAEPHGAMLLPLLVAAILFGGPQIQFLRPSIFVESVLWSGALAAVFVYLVLRGWTRDGGFTSGLLAALAAVAGLCLLTRVSTALGLYVALGLLVLWRAWGELHRPVPGRRASRLLALALPLGVLLAFAAAAGLVNQQRWGNPLVFVDLTRALILEHFPERLTRLNDYGEFNLARLGFGLIYYFVPVWVLRDDSGQLLWGDFVRQTIDAAELPPSSFLVSDPLIIGLAAYGVLGLARAAVQRRAPIVLSALGLLLPSLLMLVAISFAFRYRMEFYPLFELCAFVGFLRLASPSRRGRIAFAAGAAVSVIAAHALWVLSALSPFGPAANILGRTGIVQFYFH
jgi:hypothetical protein